LAMRGWVRDFWATASVAVKNNTQMVIAVRIKRKKRI
jgi:hypothetical protein